MWKVLVFASGSSACSLTVLVLDGGTAPVVEVPVPPTVAKLRIDDLKAGRLAAKRREVVRRVAMLVSGVGAGWFGIGCSLLRFKKRASLRIYCLQSVAEEGD